jgi:DNA-binding transcriptional MerR regulator
MRIGDLSRRSGVPIPTIKYYVREGMLPAGERAKVNQVEYQETHLHRLGLIRALLEVGGLSVRTAGRVLAQLDDPQITPLLAMGKAHYALLAPDHPADPPHSPDRRDEPQQVDDLITGLGWTVGPNNPARHALAETLVALHRLGVSDLPLRLDRYAAAAAELAAQDVDIDVASALDQPALDQVTERVVLWTVLGDQVFSALRRMAQESELRRRLSPTPPG